MNKRLRILLLLCISLASYASVRAESVSPARCRYETVITGDDSVRIDSADTKPTPDSASRFHKEKLIAAILAFPVPFGFTGLHRIYLGSDPWIPVVYLITGGGGLGLVPLIDFIFIVTANEEEFRKYENNPKFFMWIE